MFLGENLTWDQRADREVPDIESAVGLRRGPAETSDPRIASVSISAVEDAAYLVLVPRIQFTAPQHEPRRWERVIPAEAAFGSH